MRRVLSLAIAGVFILIVSAAQAQAQTITFTAQLHGGNEVPGRRHRSAGTAAVTWNTATKTGTYRVDVYNMPVGTTASHIHAGAPGVGRPGGRQLHRAGGRHLERLRAERHLRAAPTSSSAPPQGINSCEDFEQALLLGNTYVNVHSTVNSGGEIRGQLVRQ